MKLLLAQTILIILMIMCLIFLNSKYLAAQKNFNDAWDAMNTWRTLAIKCEAQGGIMTIHPIGEGKSAGMDGGCMRIGVSISTEK